LLASVLPAMLTVPVEATAPPNAPVDGTAAGRTRSEI
jgi:hypothetical protein